MNTWTPLWSSTVDSTLWEEPKDVRIMFLTMLMVRDPDHVVRMPLRVLAKKANLSEDKEEQYRLAAEAIKVLESPDERSRDNQEFEGRRIERVGEHWLVLNGEKYLEQMKTLWARMRKTQKQRQRREEVRTRKKRKVGALPGERAFVKAEEAGDQKLADQIVENSFPVFNVTEAKDAPAEEEPPFEQ